MNPGNNHIIVFDTVITNSGNGYNHFSGVFTTPEAGYYIFSYTMVTFPGQRLPVEFVCNGTTISSTAADSVKDTVYPSASGTFITYLDATSICILRTSTDIKWGAVGDLYSSDWSRSSISGWKLPYS